MISNVLRVSIMGISISSFVFGNGGAQTQSWPTWLGFYGAHQEYRGDFDNQMPDFGVGYAWILGLNLNQYLNPVWDIELSLTYEELDYLDAFSTSLVSSNFLVNFKPSRSRTRITPLWDSKISPLRLK